MATGTERDQRREMREPLVSSIFWKCVSSTSIDAFSEGIVVNESEFGMGILTLSPVKKGCVLELYGEKRWTGPKHGTVKWCAQMEPSIYGAGLIVSND
jgi:hypothetical protein